MPCFEVMLRDGRGAYHTVRVDAAGPRMATLKARSRAQAAQWPEPLEEYSVTEVRL